MKDKQILGTMEQVDCLVLNLNKICRACLGENESMTNLFNIEQNQANLLEMFITVASIEVKQSNILSACICKECEEKLSASYNFRQQCQKSNQVLLEYISTNKHKASHDTVIHQEENDEIKIEESEIKQDDSSDSNCEKNSDDSDYEPLLTKKARVKKKPRDVKQTMRLTQFSYDEVSQAIEESRRKFFENTECIRCGFVGSNTRALSVHMSHLHKDLKERWCPHCNGEFENLAEHIKMHGNEDLKCQFCDKIFQAKGHLTEHLRSHSGVRPYKCESCDKCFISQRHLKVHFRIHSNERPYKCHLCTRSFIQHNSLKNHLKHHDKGTSKYFCPECNKEFKDKASFTKHGCAIRTENGESAEVDIDSCKQESGIENGNSQNVFVIPQNFCVKCNKKVRSLALHTRQVHSDESKVFNEYGDNVLDNKLCTVCGKQFKTASKLRVHMRVHTGEAPYKCSFCDKRVSTRNQLVVHERIHTGERPHVCHVCGKGFAQSSVLNTHMRLHTGRPEVCKICEQRFCRPAELRLHMRKHTGEKPYLCTECGQAFIQRSHLVEHNKTHSDLRPYQCTYCEKAFKQNSSLKSHIQIHLGCKPFKCSQCPYACRQSYSLTQHMKQHSSDAPRPDRPHMCLICNKTFTTVAMLTSHASTVHNVNTCLFDP